MSTMFQKATKKEARARIGLCGPGGGGKSYTALSVAKVFTDRIGGRLAALDTERGSLSLYADRFDFDVLELAPPYEPHRVVEAIKAAEADQRYSTILIDSASHFWEGEGGTLDMVDAAGQRSYGGNRQAGWAVGTPAYRRMVDTILGTRLHVIVTMRTKTEWVPNESGKGFIRVGVAPVMRAGIEYEFTVMADLDLEHRLTITKSRCTDIADRVFQANTEADFANLFLDWLLSGKALADPVVIEEITTAFGRIANADVRKTVKRDFVQRFGRPDSLTEEDVAEALAFIVEHVGGIEGEDTGGSSSMTEVVPVGVAVGLPGAPSGETDDPDEYPDEPR